MDQRCHLSAVWLTWLGVPLLGIVVALRAGWIAAVFVVAVGAIAQIAYVRWFPYVSRWIGYGSVTDVAADPATLPAGGVPRVVLYTASACPFCPIVKERLFALQQHMGFEFDDVDVTFRPDVIRAKGLRSVPVVEVGGRVLVGNATSERLAAFIREAAADHVAQWTR